MTVIIPAYNEEAVIARTLTALVPGDHGVIVVCNGCGDRTADASRAVPRVRVIETEIGSKTNALNLGDAAAGDDFPRFYVDADVTVSTDDLYKMAQALVRRGVHAVAPTVQHDLNGASWFVKAFYDIDGRLPSRREGIGGSGVYGVSAEGRKRWGEFPKITADDAFVRLQFTPDERMTVPDAFSIVTPPKTLAGVIAIKTRSHFGNYEIAKLYPELLKNRGSGRNRPVLIKLGLCPWLWPKLAVYSYVKIMARIRARKRIRNAEYVWERDDTSRRPAEAGSHG